MERMRAEVYGYVQGVGFRWHTRRMASRLGVSGHVCNRGDGSVEVVAEGERQVLQDLLSWLHRGPSHAQVDRVDVEWLPATGDRRGFEVRY